MITSPAISEGVKRLPPFISSLPNPPDKLVLFTNSSISRDQGPLANSKKCHFHGHHRIARMPSSESSEVGGRPTSEAYQLLGPNEGFKPMLSGTREEKTQINGKPIQSRTSSHHLQVPKLPRVQPQRHRQRQVHWLDRALDSAQTIVAERVESVERSCNSTSRIGRQTAPVGMQSDSNHNAECDPDEISSYDWPKGSLGLAYSISPFEAPPLHQPRQQFNCRELKPLNLLLVLGDEGPRQQRQADAPALMPPQTNDAPIRFSICGLRQWSDGPPKMAQDCLRLRDPVGKVGRAGLPFNQSSGIA
ncbi:unnamed protein product [Protopolystoma xenopodis]|uniref:Uncharacterized protein n=1 Tax=Protopolystoma xenopodis TaxID=117903 RepID=A0A3S5BTC0_9PLAT|nr:unnamed protein product [Protopolystoma xenopodis]